MKKQITGKVSFKNYRCTSCGTEKKEQTNHYGEIYPWCSRCRSQTVWECLEKVPDGWGVPEKWKMVSLGDICEIIEDKKSKK